MKRLFFLASGTVLMIALLAAYGAAAEKAVTFKLSVDTVENHHRNKGLKIFRCLLEKNSNGRLKVEYYHSAQLYKGRDVVKAIRLGTVEMAVPSISWLGGVEPNTAITSLPMFYGLPERTTKKLIDGSVGELLTTALEKKLDVKVLGKWYYHGYANICTKTKPLIKLEDWQGMKLRYPGGVANSLRLKALGANPIMIPWPDTPMAILQGTADGLITTYNTFAGAKLWETGVRYTTKDKEYYVNYVPMVNGKFWRGLSTSLQKIFLDTWEEHIDMQRAITDFEQNKAEDIMKENGVKIYYPSEEQLSKWRERVLTLQDQVIKELGMDKAVVAKAQEYVDQALKK